MVALQRDVGFGSQTGSPSPLETWIHLSRVIRNSAGQKRPAKLPRDSQVAPRPSAAWIEYLPILKIFIHCHAEPTASYMFGRLFKQLDPCLRHLNAPEVNLTLLQPFIQLLIYHLTKIVPSPPRNE
jgi:hypothetical protein